MLLFAAEYRPIITENILADVETPSIEPKVSFVLKNNNAVTN
jgi:hypothetical protein